MSTLSDAPRRWTLLRAGDHPVVAAVWYWLVSYRRIWRSSVFSSFVIPLLWLSAIGLGVGGYIDRGSADLGVPYLSYLAPGLIASAVLNTGVGECTWPVMGALKWNRQYHAMLATPLRVVDVVLGHLGYVVLRLTMTAVAFFVAMALFGTLHSGWAPLAVPVAVLTGAAAATATYAFAVTVRVESRLAVLFRFGVVPVTLFSGVFFPVEQLPGFLLPLAWLSPLWHGVELCRAAVLGFDTALAWPLHVAYLLVWLAVGLYLGCRLLKRRVVV